MQKIAIIGNLGGDAVIRKSSNSQDDFLSFSVACNESYTDKEGNKVEKTQWYEVTYNKTGLAKYLPAGTKVYVEGRPSYGQYLNKEGKTVVNVTLAAKFIELLSPGKREE